MPHDPDQMMMHGVNLHMLIPVFVLAFVISITVVLSILLIRRVSGSQLPVAGLASVRRVPALEAFMPISSDPVERQELHDTIFVLPDISHYTQFMTGTQFSHAHAQHIIFSLINAMIEVATRTVHLSKLEGDAALFFTDANRVNGSALTDCLMDIFKAFYTERRNLISTNICPCKSCRDIGILELKIFVHRGKAARFSFRGAIDHFGTDVIVLHRIMKNDVDGDRYVMATESAVGSLKLPQTCHTYAVQETVADFGEVRATVFEIDDEMAARLVVPAATPTSSAWGDSWRKLIANLYGLRRALTKRRATRAAD